MMMRLRDEILLGLLVSLALALILRDAHPATNEGTATEPFRTHSGVILIRFTAYPDRPPTIEEITTLPEGRITTFVPGENTLRLVAEDGTTLYSGSFVADFLLTMHPSAELDRQEFVMILPGLARATRVVVATSQGEVSRPLNR